MGKRFAGKTNISVPTTTFQKICNLANLYSPRAFVVLHAHKSCAKAPISVPGKELRHANDDLTFDWLGMYSITIPATLVPQVAATGDSDGVAILFHLCAIFSCCFFFHAQSTTPLLPRSERRTSHERNQAIG